MTFHQGVTHIGRATPRYEGPEKVTGKASYAADFHVPGMAYGVVVSATIASGRIARLDASAALAMPGVAAVFSHLNCPPMAESDSAYKDQIAVPGTPFRPFYDDRIAFSGQPVALVVADDFETARYAATLVEIDYAAEPHQTDLEVARAFSYEPPKKRMPGNPAKSRGEAGEAIDAAELKVAAEYHSPPAHHNPMEMHATTAVWESDDAITVHDKTQGSQNSRDLIAKVFGYKTDNVAVISPFVGGAFGIGLRPKFQLLLAVLAARAMKRSVQIMLTRQQMFTLGHRPETVQDVAMGADSGGRLKGLVHKATAATSAFEDYQENVVNWAEQLYKTPNSALGYELAKLDTYTPADMRAPGGALGVFALECTADEMAEAAGLDPIEFRLRNYTETDQAKGKPFSTKQLRQCFRRGAERFGWDRRKAAIGIHRDGHERIGLGMASGIWEAHQMKATARIVLSANGTVEVMSSMGDIGPGTYTMVAQIAADTTGMPLDSITVTLGDSRLPKGPVQGGSWTAASLGTAVQLAGQALSKKVLSRVTALDGSPLADAREDDVVFGNGEIALKSEPSTRMPVAAAFRDDAAPLEAEGTSGPGLLQSAAIAGGLNTYSNFTHSAVFAEVAVDDELGIVRTRRIVVAVDAGRIVNPTTARSQIIGGVVWGIGMALHEETMTDHAYGRFMNHSLAEYHVPVNADIGEIDVIFVEEPDTHMNPLGIKGLGEIGTVGTAAAIANAIYNATGKRVRNLPITLDKLL